MKDRFGFNVEPQEWFLVPLPAIEEAMQKIQDAAAVGDERILFMLRIGHAPKTTARTRRTKPDISFS